MDNDHDNPVSIEGGDACPSIDGSLPRWLLPTKLLATTINSEIIAQYRKISAEFSTASPERQNLLSFLIDNPKIHKLQHLSNQNGIHDLNVALEDFQKSKRKILIIDCLSQLCLKSI